MATIFNYHLIVVLTADLLATAGDVTYSWTSPIYPKLYSNDSSINPLGTPITPDEDSWLGSLATVGALLCFLPYGYISGKFGRKIALLAVAIPHIISFTIFAFATHIYLFYAARFLGGIALGGGYFLLPMYISEISRDANRGAMSLTLNVFWAIGNFLPYAIGPFMSIYWFNITLALIPTTFFVLFIILAPESPYYLVEVGRIKEAEKSLMLLRSCDEEGIKEELRSILAYTNIAEDSNFWETIKDKSLRKAFCVSLVLIMTQDLSGFTVITNHLQSIFESAGTNMAPEIAALIVGLLLFVSSFIAPFLVDRAGRRPLTIWSCLGMCAALTMLGAFFYFQSREFGTRFINWMPIFSLIFYIVSFNMGICAMPWVLTSELFPNKAKRVAVSFATVSCSIMSFITTKTFNDLGEWVGKSGTFWLFAGWCLCSALFSIAFVPETKGMSFSEIQQMLNADKGDQREINEVELMLMKNGKAEKTVDEV
nr:facilitated trehalose transporter Tret1-like [Leptinotarsa decemlineata]